MKSDCIRVVTDLRPLTSLTDAAGASRKPH